MPPIPVVHPCRALLILFVGLAWINASTRAANSGWSVKKWDLEDGLPALAITGLAQSDDGFLWIATRATLTRFDGVGFEHFPSTRFMPGPTRGFRAMIRSRRGGLWLAADPNQIVHLGNGAPEVFTMPVEQAVLGLAEDAAGGLWISYAGGLVAHLHEGKIEVIPPAKPTVGSPGIFVFAVDQAGKFWFTQQGTFGKVDSGRFIATSHLPAGNSSISAAADGGIWLSAGARLLKYNGAELQDLGRFHAAEDVAVESMIEDRNGALWIGTATHGVFRYSDQRFESIATSDRRIDVLLADREANIWIGSNGGGLERLQPRAIVLEGTAQGLPVEMIQSICEDTAGTLWAVTGNGQLVRRVDERWVPVTRDDGQPVEGATCVAADRDGAIWVGTRRALVLRHLAEKWTSWDRSKGLQGQVVHVLLATSTGDMWIACDSPDTLHRFRKNILEEVKLPAPARRLRAMVEDRAGNLWISGDRVLVRLSGENIIDETAHIQAVGKGIRSLLPTADGALWIGFGGGGLARLKDGRLHRVTTVNGLADDRISQLMEDGLGWFWIGSDRGLFKVAQAELSALFANETTRVRSTYYSRNVGLPSLPAMFGEWPGNTRSRDGRLWMPLRTGLAVVDPRRLPQDAGAPAVRLREIRVDGEIVAAYGTTWSPAKGIDLASEPAEVRLAPGHRRLEFDVTALTFRAPENVQFRYRLEGLDEEWLHGGTQRRVSYSRIPAGQYRFRASASNSDGVWNPIGASVVVQVTPFVWQTWWFRTLAFGSFTLLLVGSVRFWSHRRLRAKLRGLEQQVALDRERARIARDIHDDLGGSLTQIALLSDRALHNAAPSDPGAPQLNAISSRVQEGIRSLDEIVWAINPSNDTLEHLLDYIGQYAVDFLQLANIRCEVDVPVTLPARVVPADARHSLFLAVKETLNNVVRHAAATQVTFRAIITADTVQITIIDNGRGFVGPPHDAYANGHRNLQQRMDEAGGSYRIESAVGCGTTARLSLRVGGPVREIRTNVP
jgi:signal transduction histidine kinase/ligand-binding sensor domain-containing protein